MEHLLGHGLYSAIPFTGQLVVVLLAMFCTVVRCIVCAIGTVLFGTKVCTVHVDHFPSVSCMHF